MPDRPETSYDAATPAGEPAGSPAPGPEGSEQPTPSEEPTLSAQPTDEQPAPEQQSPEQAATGDERLPGSGETVESARIAELQATVAERTADLQRLQAEYVNYRRRVERDRDLVRDTAVASVLSELMTVLDDVHLARQHGDLEGPFKAVAESLETVLAKLGLQRYGEPGEPFDPQVHEALMHSHSAEVTEPTAVQILQPGYRLVTGNGERVLRPARVAVADPEND